MISFSIKPLVIHFLLILLAYTIIFVPSSIIYNNTNDSFETYEEFLSFEENIFIDLKNFQSKILTKDDLNYIYSEEDNFDKIEYLQGIQNIFKRYIKEVDKFNIDNLDDQLAALNIKMKQVNLYISKILVNPSNFKNINIEKEIHDVIFMIYDKNNTMNYKNFQHYSLVNLEYYKDTRKNLENFKYIFFVFIVLFFISIYNWNQRRLTEKFAMELLIKYKMVFDACQNSVMLLNNKGQIIEINEKLRRKLGAPKHFFKDKNYKDIIKKSELYKIMVENVEEKDLLKLETAQDCELETYSDGLVNAQYYVSSVNFKDSYLYLVNFKNIQHKP